MSLTTRSLLTCGAVLITTGLAGARSQTPQTAGERYKSIQVLKAIPSDRVIPTMAAIANSLGVTCGHCHTTDWESDAKPEKQKAREMIRMTQAINRDYYAGQLVVTCQTCHDGRVIPASVPRVDDAGWNRAATPPVPSLPAAETLLAAYLQGLGGESAIQRLKNRRVTGTATRFNGRTEPVSGPFQLDQDASGAVQLSAEL